MALNGFTAQQQHVSGIRFFFGICGGGNSTPLQNCGSGNYTLVTGPTTSWTTNLQNFFLDVYNAGIRNVTPSMSHGDWIGAYGGLGLPAWYVAPSKSPAGSNCTNALLLPKHCRHVRRHDGVLRHARWLLECLLPRRRST
jgi:hypothetical protein